uniref:Uncharacterized protein n=1 Tax=Panagrolaimus sp. ES5 TaxID=591445 RepID=A0AC34F9L9_9BILA
MDLVGLVCTRIGVVAVELEDSKDHVELEYKRIAVLGHIEVVVVELDDNRDLVELEYIRIGVVVAGVDSMDLAGQGYKHKELELVQLVDNRGLVGQVYRHIVVVVAGVDNMDHVERGYRHMGLGLLEQLVGSKDLVELGYMCIEIVGVGLAVR